MQAFGRIDYVRLRFPFDTLENAAANEDWRNAALAVCEEHGYSPNCYGYDMYYDAALKRKIPYFNCWGPAAHYFFQRLPVNQFGYIMRLDYREPIEAPTLDFDNMFALVRARNKGKMSTKHIDSPFRSKSGGRDTGGNGIAVGSEQGQRRISIYQRAAEGAAFEFQVGGRACRKLVNDALRGDAPEKRLWQEVVFDALQKAAHNQLFKCCAFTMHDIENGLPKQKGINDYTDPVAVYDQARLFFDLLAPAQKEVFLNEVVEVPIATALKAVDAGLLVNAQDWDENESDQLEEVQGGDDGAELDTPEKREAYLRGWQN